MPGKYPKPQTLNPKIPRVSLPLIACTCLGGSSLGSTRCLGKFLKGTLPQSSTSKTSDRCPCDLCRFRVLQDPLLFVLWCVVDCLSVVLYCHSSSFHRTSIPAASLFVDRPVYVSVPVVGLRVGDAVVTSPTRATCHPQAILLSRRLTWMDAFLLF